MRNDKVHVMTGDLIREVGESRDRRPVGQTLETFLQVVNAIMNTNNSDNTSEVISSKICVHTDKPHLLGEFDKKVDDKLVKLISDDSQFNDNFRRYFHDKKHVIFEVKSRARPHSTLDFHTKLSLNKGLCDPTHGQMLRLLSGAPSLVNEGSSPAQEKPQNFVKNAEVKVKASSTEDIVPFQECISLQAKPSKDKLRSSTRGRANRVEEQVAMWWNDKAVCQYVSAFSKLPQGGSIYLGVREDVIEGKQTGRFYPNGIVLNDAEKNALKQSIENKIREEMIWIPEGKKPTVRFTFHTVQGGEDNEVVVEVSVSHFPGVGFFRKCGPRSYQHDGRGTTETRLEHWHQLMAETTKTNPAKKARR